VPGPRIELTDGDRVRIVVTNHLPEPDDRALARARRPNAMDGPAEITQAPIQPGDSYTYEFTVQQAGRSCTTPTTTPTANRRSPLRRLIVKPENPALDRRLNYSARRRDRAAGMACRDGLTYPAMLMEGGLPNFLHDQRQGYPDTQPIRMRVGERVRIRFIGTNNNFVHRCNIHVGPFEIVATDGNPVTAGARLLKGDIGRRRPGRTLRRLLDRTTASGPPLSAYRHHQPTTSKNRRAVSRPDRSQS